MKFSFDTDTGKFTVHGNAGVDNDGAAAIAAAFTTAFQTMLSRGPAPYRANSGKVAKPLYKGPQVTNC